MSHVTWGDPNDFMFTTFLAPLMISLLLQAHKLNKHLAHKKLLYCGLVRLKWSGYHQSYIHEEDIYIYIEDKFSHLFK